MVAVPPANVPGALLPCIRSTPLHTHTRSSILPPPFLFRVEYFSLLGSETFVDAGGIQLGAGEPSLMVDPNDPAIVELVISS